MIFNFFGVLYNSSNSLFAHWDVVLIANLQIWIICQMTKLTFWIFLCRFDSQHSDQKDSKEGLHCGLYLKWANDPEVADFICKLWLMKICVWWMMTRIFNSVFHQKYFRIQLCFATYHYEPHCQMKFEFPHLSFFYDIIIYDWEEQPFHKYIWNV